MAAEAWPAREGELSAPRASRRAGDSPVQELAALIQTLLHDAVRGELAELRAEVEALRARPDGAAATAMADQVWLTTGHVADRIHRDVSTVRRAAETGLLHGHQRMRGGHPVANSRWTFHGAAVDAWVQGLDERAQRNACCGQLRIATKRLRQAP